MYAHINFVELRAMFLNDNHYEGIFVRFIMIFSRKKLTPDASYLHLLKDVDFKPVFILGNPRSGTTLLYNLLARTECFNFLTAYQVINYDEILLNHVNRKEDSAKADLDRQFTTMKLGNRGFDEIPVSPNMPEEYGFVLKNSGYWYKLSSKSLPRFIEMCKKVQLVSAIDRELLLKSPLDYPNFKYLKSTFPEAKFVFIHRNPIHMINSLLKAVRASLDTKNPLYALIQRDYGELFDKPFQLKIARFVFSSHFSLGLRLFTLYYGRTFNYFLRNIGILDHSDYISVRYEDLCDEPDKYMAEILEFLRLEKSKSLNFRELVKPRKSELLEEVKRKKSSILKKFADYLAYCQYDINSL